MSLFVRENTVVLELSDGSLVFVAIDVEESEDASLVLSYSFDETAFNTLSTALRDELREKIKRLHDEITDSLVNFTILKDLKTTQNKLT